MKHLVVGVDGSASSEMAIHWASAVASATGARITVAHVVDDGDHEDVSARFMPTAGRPAMLVGAVSTNPVGHDYEVLHGDPPTRILELAAEVEADMIVIGRRVHRPAAPRLLGSFTRQLLQRNELPVVVVPAPSEQLPRPDLTATAVVGLDGTESARSVLNCALSLSEAVGLDMDVLTTVDLHGETGSDTGKLERRDVRSVQRLLRGLVSTVDPQRIRHVNAHAEVGVASDELLRRSRYAELLVVGHRRRSPIGRFLSHATGRYCAAHSTCPVVMVPIEPPQATPDGSRW